MGCGHILVLNISPSDMALTGVPIDCTFREIIDIALILFLNLYDI